MKDIINKNNKNELLSKLEELWDRFNRSRSVLPFIPRGLKKVQGIISAPRYRNIPISMYAAKVLSDEQIDLVNDTGHYNNQNFIIRLFALLDFYEIFKGGIDKSAEGGIDVDILKRLRNKFAHSSGKFRPDKSSHKQLNDDMVKHYNLTTPPNHPDEYRLPIDTVLSPMYDGCKIYSVQVIQNRTK